MAAEPAGLPVQGLPVCGLQIGRPGGGRECEAAEGHHRAPLEAAEVELGQQQNEALEVAAEAALGDAAVAEKKLKKALPGPPPKKDGDTEEAGPRGALAAFNAWLYPLSRAGDGGTAGKAPRLEALDAPRWIASIQIVVYHMYEKELGKDLSRWFAFQTQLFFLLSGFVLSYVELVRPPGRGRQLSVLQYLRRRLTVIYPIYLLSLLLFVAGASPRLQHTSFEWGALPFHALLMHAWLPVCKQESWGFSCSPWIWNGESWFLSVLVVYWILLRPLAELFRRRSVSACGGVIGACWLWSAMFHAFGHKNALAHWLGCEDGTVCSQTIMVAIRAGPLGYLHVLIAGVAAARIFICVAVLDADTGGPVGPQTKRAVLKADQAPAVLKYGCCFGYLGYALLIAFATGTNEEYYYFYHNGGLMPVMMLVLIGAAVGEDPLTVWLFRSKPMLVLGRISYAQYLMQHALFWWMRAAFGWQDNRAARILYLPLLLAFAYCCQRFVEGPATEYQRWRQEKGIKGCDDRWIEWLDGLAGRCGRRCRRGEAQAADAEQGQAP